MGFLWGFVWFFFGLGGVVSGVWCYGVVGVIRLFLVWIWGFWMVVIWLLVVCFVFVCVLFGWVGWWLDCCLLLVGLVFGSGGWKCWFCGCGWYVVGCGWFSLDYWVFLGLCWSLCWNWFLIFRCVGWRGSCWGWSVGWWGCFGWVGRKMNFVIGLFGGMNWGFCWIGLLLCLFGFVLCLDNWCWRGLESLVLCWVFFYVIDVWYEVLKYF